MRSAQVTLLSVLLVGCATRGAGPGTERTHASAAQTAEPASGVLLLEMKCSPAALRSHDETGSRWSVAVFDRWSGFSWVITAKEAVGPVSIQKFYDPSPRHETDVFGGSWTWDPENGDLRIDSPQAHGPVVAWWVNAQLGKDGRSALGQMGETFGPPAHDEPTESKREVLVVVREGGLLLNEFADLYSCAADALGKLQ